MAVEAKKLKAFADQHGGGAKFGKMKKGAKYEDEKNEHEHEHEDGEHEDEHEEEEEHGDKKDKKVDVDAIGKKVQDGKGDKKLMELSKDIDEEHNPPGSITDEDIWEKAKKAVKPKWDDYDEPYAVVMHVYKQMGGGLKHESE